MKIRKMKAGSSSGKSAVSPKPSPKTPGSAGSTASSSASAATVSADKKIKDMLRELHRLITQVQNERDRSDHNLANISKTHERIQQEAKNSISPYYKSKLKGLYNTAMQDAESESDLLRSALEKIAEIKAFSKERTGDRPKPMRRGVLMTMLQQSAQTLPLWIGKPGEKPPPLCGAIPAEPNYIARPGDTVAARVKSADEEENWILAEVVSYNTNTNRYEVDDIDAEDGVERHTLSKRRVVPLPIYKANPETDPESLFPNNTLVLALYPQTTCFYRALIHEPPQKPKDDYSVLFEDTSYPDGYSPPLHVAQRYVIACKEDKKK